MSERKPSRASFSAALLLAAFGADAATGFRFGSGIRTGKTCGGFFQGRAVLARRWQ
jgi:hypothetical protein